MELGGVTILEFYIENSCIIYGIANFDPVRRSNIHQIRPIILQMPGVPALETVILVQWNIQLIHANINKV